MTLHKVRTLLTHSFFHIVQKEEMAAEIATKFARVN